MKRISRVFRNRSGEENARKYVLGLMSGAERKNSWQLAENLGEKTPYALQQFLYRGNWDADELRDEMRAYVTETLGDSDGVLIMHETGFLKQGKKSCGVKRQYSGQTNAPPRPGWKRHLLIRKSKTSDELRAYACCAPEATTLQKLVEVAGRRWEVEDSFAETKSMVGLDQYGARSYNGWYKHITLACVAHALLTPRICARFCLDAYPAQLKRRRRGEKGPGPKIRPIGVYHSHKSFRESL